MRYLVFLKFLGQVSFEVALECCFANAAIGLVLEETRKAVNKVCWFRVSLKSATQRTLKVDPV